MIAALYVVEGGCYFGLPDVDPWPESRDARTYVGPWPVVAHPPCARWSRLAPLVEAVHGYKRGDDGGCFASALASVRAWGGVLEHPAASYAWAAHDLPAPARFGWQRGACGGWSCEVEQWHYGHPARKRTWLYFVGAAPPPTLEWGPPPADAVTAYVTDGGGDVKRRWSGRVDPRRRRLRQSEALATPIPFRDLLLDLARGTHRHTEAA